MTEDPRENPFWKDDTLVCPCCGGCKCHTCSCPGGPRGPKLPVSVMTSHTETTSEVTEVINSMDYGTGYTYSVSGHGVQPSGGNIVPDSVKEHTVRAPASTTNSNGISSTWTGLNLTSGSRPSWSQTTPGGNFSFVESYMGTRSPKSHCDRENHKNPIRNRYDKYLYAVISACSIFISPLNAVAETVGGVKRNRKSCINSSEPVTNQEVFKFYKDPTLPISTAMESLCQGPTLNLTPYVTRSYQRAVPL